MVMVLAQTPTIRIRKTPKAKSTLDLSQVSWMMKGERYQ
jgi:hypothetical protein